jgi:glycosyltransferase involved in cell wall biosynthesis
VTAELAYPPPGSVPVSVLIPTKDEADQIAACLASVAWAAEVAVVDSESADGTAERARAAGATVWTRRFDGYGPQKNWALARLGHPWALCVDADERVTPELAREVAAALAGPAGAGAAGAPVGYRIPRWNHFLGRRITRCGWGGETVLRLFRRDRGRFDAPRVHERVELDGPAGELAGALLHYPYRTWAQCEDKLWRYAVAGALEAHARGRRTGAAAMWLRPPARFARMYLLQGGLLEGGAGAALCGLAAAQAFLKYALLWDLGRRGAEAARELEAGRH